MKITFETKQQKLTVIVVVLWIIMKEIIDRNLMLLNSDNKIEKCILHNCTTYSVWCF